MNHGNINLYQGDCLEVMKEIKDKSIDMILCDLPYGTTKCKWDIIIPFDKLWEQYNRIIKDNGAILLFGSEPFSSKLRLSNLDNYKYDIYWVKEKPTNFMQVKRRVGKLTENICVFYKKQCTYNPQMVKYNGKKVINKPSETNAKFKSVVASDSPTMQIKPYEDTGYRYPCDILNNGQMAMFLKIQFLEGQKRKELFEKYPPKYIYVFRNRMAIWNNGLEKDPKTGKKWATTMCHAWFIWEKGSKSEPIIRWL